MQKDKTSYLLFRDHIYAQQNKNFNYIVSFVEGTVTLMRMTNVYCVCLDLPRMEEYEKYPQVCIVPVCTKSLSPSSSQLDSVLSPGTLLGDQIGHFMAKAGVEFLTIRCEFHSVKQYVFLKILLFLQNTLKYTQFLFSFTILCFSP